MSPFYIVLVSLPLDPWTHFFYRRWCPSASHHPVSFLFLLAQSFPLYFPFLSLGRLCQQSPLTFPVSLLCVGSTQRRATSLAVGQVRPKPVVGGGGGCIGTWHDPGGDNEKGVQTGKKKKTGEAGNAEDPGPHDLHSGNLLDKLWTGFNM